MGSVLIVKVYYGNIIIQVICDHGLKFVYNRLNVHHPKKKIINNKTTAVKKKCTQQHPPTILQTYKTCA